MSSATQAAGGQDSWQTPRNARTLRAYMALQNQEIAGRIRELRGRRPQTAVAEALGVAERTYQNWEAGDAKPNYRSLQALAEYYGVGEDYILSGTGQPPTSDGKTETPDLLGESQLDRIERAVTQADVDRDDIRKLLRRQSNILDGIERVLASQLSAAKRMEEAAALLRALREPPESPDETR